MGSIDLVSLHQTLTFTREAWTRLVSTSSMMSILGTDCRNYRSHSFPATAVPIVNIDFVVTINPEHCPRSDFMVDHLDLENNQNLLDYQHY